MYLIIDLETTGLPKNYNASLKDFDNWPRIVEIAWLLYGSGGNKRVEKQYIIKPIDFEIPWYASLVHGITNEIAKKNGCDIIFVLNEFVKDMMEANYLVSHNILFDKNILGSELYRHKIKIHNRKPMTTICTMMNGINICGIPGKNGNLKWPKLTELYYVLFGKILEEKHRAMDDAFACSKCFFELKRRNIIKINNE